MNVLNEQSERTPTRPDQSRLLASVLRMYPFASRPLKARRAASIQLRGRAVVVRRNFKAVPAVLIIFASIPRPPRSEPRAARPPREGRGRWVPSGVARAPGFQLHVRMNTAVAGGAGVRRRLRDGRSIGGWSRGPAGRSGTGESTAGTRTIRIPGAPPQVVLACVVSVRSKKRAA